MEMKPMINEWHINIGAISIALVIFCLYLIISGFKKHKNNWCFWLAIGCFLLVNCSPSQYFGPNKVFSAHMIGHIVLLLICGPLLVISLPSKPVFRTLKPLLAISTFFGRNAWVAWLTGVGVMWLWHVPMIFNSSIGDNMALKSISLLLAGMIFSWPLFGPVVREHIHPMSGIIYLFTACISCSLLGLLITFAPLNTYGHYSEADQQAAGLIMWVPCCFVYLSGCIYLLMCWFSERAGQVTDQFNSLNHLLKEHEKRQ